MFGAPFEQLDNNATANPFLYSFSKIFIPYGDGSSQVSDLDTPVSVGNATIYYRGARILRALIERLISTELAEATEVVVGGGSAGGLSTYLYVRCCAIRVYTSLACVYSVSSTLCYAATQISGQLHFHGPEL